MTDLPPGLAARRAKAMAAAATAVVSTDRKTPSRDASPVRPSAPDPTPAIVATAAASLNPSTWELEEGTNYCALWSCRLNRYISMPAVRSIGTPMTLECSPFYPYMRGFISALDKQEILELRNPRFTPEEYAGVGLEEGAKQPKPLSVIDLQHFNLRSDLKWKFISRKKRSAGEETTNPDQGVKVDQSDDDSEEENPTRAEDTLEQFAAKLKRPTAILKPEDLPWTAEFQVVPSPRGTGKKMIQLLRIKFTLKKVNKKKEKAKQKILEWEVRKLDKHSRIPSSVFYRDVTALAGQKRQSKPRFTPEQRKYYLDLHDTNGKDESDVSEEAGAVEEEEDEDE